MIAPAAVAVIAKSAAGQTGDAREADERAIAAWLSRRTSLTAAWVRTPSGAVHFVALRGDDVLLSAARDLALLTPSVSQK